MEIPKALRPAIGKSRFVRSLETDNYRTAQRRVLLHVARWRSEIERAEGEDSSEEAYWRRMLRSARTEEERQHVLSEIGMEAWSLGDGDSNDPVAADFYRRATALPFADRLDEWLASSGASPKTKDMRRSDVKRFAVRFPAVHDVTRKDVQRWAAGLVNDGLAPKTVQRILSGLRGYWRFLQSLEFAQEDAFPFDKLELAKRRNGGPKGTFRPFEPADGVKLLAAAIAIGDHDLADLIRLGMWTGCRIEELCALKVGQVKGDHFSIEDAKTAAGWRDVPIHRELVQTMARLVDGKMPEDYVLTNLTPNKYGDRSNAVGKRFGRLKSKLDFGPAHVFHSIRKTVVTSLENAGVPENVVADIVGHEKPRITYGLYSGGTTLVVKAKALAKLAYPFADH